MPIEERFISFDLDEVYKAVNIICERDDLKKPPAGKLLSIELDEADSKRQGDDVIHLNVRKRDDGEEENLKFMRKFFAEALIFYCQGSGIPLPRRGQKILAVMEDKIVMKVVVKDE